MTCSLKNKIEKQFDLELQQENVIPSNKIIGVKSYVDMLNNKMIEERFNQEVFILKNNILYFNERNSMLYDTFLAGVQTVYIDQLEQEREFDEILNDERPSYAPVTNTNNQQSYNAPIVTSTSNNIPVNFLEWENKVIELREKLDKQRSNYAKQKNSTKIKYVGEAIKKLDKQLEAFTETNIEIVHEKILNEISLMKEVLSNINNDPLNAAFLLETNRVKERLSDLALFFKGTDINGNTVTNQMVTLLKNTYSEQVVNTIQNKITLLIKEYNDSTGNIIKSMFEKSNIVQLQKDRLLSTENKTQQQIDDDQKQWDDFYETAQKIIDNKEQDVNFIERFIAGRGVDSLVTNLLVNIREEIYNAEVGATQPVIDKFTKVWDKIKNETYVLNGKKRFLIDKLFEVNELGVKLSELLKPFTQEFTDLYSTLNAYKNAFYNSRTTANYSAYMNFAKDNYDVFDLSKLKMFKDIYSNIPDFSGYFTHTDAEMENYEQELIARLGQNVFKKLYDKQIEKIDSFLFEIKANSFVSLEDKYNKNPLAFINNFLSSNYDNKDLSTGNFNEVNFIEFIPNSRTQVNSKLLDLESENNQSLMDVWYYADDLIRNYANPTFQSNGIFVKSNSFMLERAIVDREALKNMSFFKGLKLKYFYSWYTPFMKSFASNNDNNDYRPDSKLTEKELERRKKQEESINAGYDSYGSELVPKYKKIYKKMSYDQLLDIFNKEGYSIDNIDLSKYSENNVKKMIIDSLIQLKINQNTSSNIYNSVLSMVDVARSMNARNVAFNSSEIMKDNLRTVNTKQSVNHLAYFKDYVALNIQQKKFIYDFFGIGQKKIPFLKFRTELEKDLVKLLKEDGSSESIELAKTIGTRIQINSVLLGLKNNISKSLLTGWRASGYILNRKSGGDQTLNAIVSGQTRLKMESLLDTRRFLTFNDLSKVGNKVKSIFTPKLTLYQKKIKSIDMLMDSLRLRQNTMDELKSEGDFKSNKAVKEVKIMLSDLGTNLPEWKNQTEIMIAFLRQTMIETINKDANGNIIYKPFFDGKNFAYIPGTNKLDTEFATENNKKNWETFEKNDDGKAPQNLLIQEYKDLRDITQGNYSQDDKAPNTDGGLAGKLSTMMIKWLIGNSTRQLYNKEINLALAKTNTKGVKKALIERPFVAALHLGTVFGVPGRNSTIIASIIGASGGTLLIASATATIAIPVVSAVAFIVYNKFKKNKQELRLKQEFLLAINHALEIAVRCTNIIPNYFDVEIIKDEKIKNSKYYYKPTGMTQDERMLLSASAQEVVTKIGILTTTLIAIETTKFLMSLAHGDDDDKKLKLELLDRIINKILNFKNNLLSGIDMYTDPTQFIDTATAFVYFKKLMDIKYTLIGGDKESAYEKYDSGKISKTEMISKYTGAGLNLTGISADFINIPIGINNSMNGEINIGDQQMYAKQDLFDELILTAGMDSEKKYQTLNDSKRKKLRFDIKDAYRKQNRNNGNKPLSEEELSKKATKFLQNNHLYIKDYNSYEALYNTEKWNTINEKIDDINN